MNRGRHKKRVIKTKFTQEETLSIIKLWICHYLNNRINPWLHVRITISGRNYLRVFGYQLITYMNTLDVMLNSVKDFLNIHNKPKTIIVKIKLYDAYRVNEEFTKTFYVE